MAIGERGFAYVAALALAAVVGLGLAMVGETAARAQQREREIELVWVGRQFTQAIGLYYHRSPGTARRYPAALEDLLEDKRFPGPQRYLRRLYNDPFTGRPDWGVVASPDGGIMGVYSRSEQAPIRSFDVRATDPGPAGRYSDWRFVYTPTESAGSR